MKRLTSQFRPTQRRYTPKEKAEIFEAHRRSGLSLLAFARKEGLCYTSLLRWRSRPPKSARAPADCTPEADPGFVPVKVQSEVAGGDYVLSWASGRCLKIPPQFQRESLRRLLSVLEEVR